MMALPAMVQQCAPAVQPDTMRRIVQVESGFNPFAIGVVGGRLERQPKTEAEAVATAQWLLREGYNFSLGLAQVNRYRLAEHGLTLAGAFDPCANLRAGAAILKDCYQRALRARHDEQAALRDAFSCYYSGNFTTGYRQGYVLKVVDANPPGAVVPRLESGPAPIPLARPAKASEPARKPRKEESAPPAPDKNAQPSEPAAPQPRSALLF